MKKNQSVYIYSSCDIFTTFTMTITITITIISSAQVLKQQPTFAIFSLCIVVSQDIWFQLKSSNLNKTIVEYHKQTMVQQHVSSW